MSLRYHWADCVVDSMLALPELSPAKAGADSDVVIRMRDFPEMEQKPEPVSVWDGNSHFSLGTPVGRFLVRDGKSVDIEPVRPLDEEGVRLFLLGSAFGALALQRGIFQLHCGAVLGRTGVLAFAADSGHGKSTLIAHLAARGFPVLADDTLPLRIRQGEPPVALHAVHRLKLLPDSMQVLGLDPSAFPAIMSGQSKRSVFPSGEASRHTAAPLPLAGIYLLERADAASQPAITPVTGLDALAAIRANFYRPQYALRSGRQTAQIAAAVAIASTVSAFRLTIPWNLERIDETIRLVESHQSVLQPRQDPPSG